MKKTVILSSISLLVLIFFIALNIGSLEILPLGLTEEVQYKEDSTKIRFQKAAYLKDDKLIETKSLSEGSHDQYRRRQGLWNTHFQKFEDGEVKEEILHETNYHKGKRKGWEKITRITYSEKDTIVTVDSSYFKGNISISVPLGASSAAGSETGSSPAVKIRSSTKSSYDILTKRYPWVIDIYLLSGADSSGVRDYISYLESETKPDTNEIAIFQNYNDALNTISEVDSNLTDIHALLREMEWWRYGPGFEIRLALIDRYRKGGTTVNILQEQYSDFLDELLDLSGKYSKLQSLPTPKEEDLIDFVNNLDTMMDAYSPPLDTMNTTFLDSLDIRMFNAMNQLATNKDSYSLITTTIVLRTLMNIDPIYQSLRAFHNNAPPRLFRLLRPFHNDSIPISQPGDPILFRWDQAIDPDDDIVLYALHLSGMGVDTTISPIINTEIALDIGSQLQVGTNYQWTVKASDGISSVTSPDTFSFYVPDAMTATLKSEESRYKNVLSQNFPNPFHHETTIRYSLPGRAAVKLDVLNSQGTFIQNLVNKIQPPGDYAVRWHPSDLPPGIYTYRFQAGKHVDVKKMVVSK